MAETHGLNGGVYRKQGATLTKIASTTNWTLNVTNEQAEKRRHGDNWVTRSKGISDWNATVDALLNAGSNQTLLMYSLAATSTPAAGTDTGGTLVLALYQSAASMPRFQGPGIVSGLSPAGPAGDHETLTVDIVGNGTLLHLP